MKTPLLKTNAVARAANVPVENLGVINIFPNTQSSAFSRA